jgi:hypothetical protein
VEEATKPETHSPTSEVSLIQPEVRIPELPTSHKLVQLQGTLARGRRDASVDTDVILVFHYAPAILQLLCGFASNQAPPYYSSNSPSSSGSSHVLSSFLVCGIFPNKLFPRSSWALSLQFRIHKLPWDSGDRGFSGAYLQKPQIEELFPRRLMYEPNKRSIKNEALKRRQLGTVDLHTT